VDDGKNIFEATTQHIKTMTNQTEQANLWRRAKEVLADALLIPVAERSAFVELTCKDDLELKSEVMSLLSHAEHSTDFIEATPSLPQDDDLAITKKHVGTRVGAYILGAEIGRGGMGLVYAASRADGAYESHVAVKLLKQNVSTDKDARRMTRERQALAQLNHPNIARLIDGGNLDDGMPYLVMEYINGTQIDQYCKAKKLSLRERVVLIRKVAAAVQSAHQQLLIHRDIKPANILVDTAGEPKLLDFGIARLLDLSQDINQTQDVAAPFTPRYASPEQMRGQPVSVATDVYGLGVLLYELLAGSSPYQRFNSGEITTAAAAIEVVMSDMPRKASEVARASVNVGEADNLTGDLDIILSKAIAKLPSERYATVAALDADLQRWLEGRPILARAPTWQYTAKKFIARHRAATAMAVVAVAAISIGVTSTITQKRKTEARYTEVRQLANSLIFKYYDKIQVLPGSTGVRKELAAEGLNFLDSLAAESSNDNALAIEIANGYRQLMIVLFNGHSLPHLGDKAGAASAAKKAYALLEPIIKKEPNNNAANLVLAELDNETGVILAQENPKDGLARIEGAIQRYAQVLARDPANKDAAYKLVQAHFSAVASAMNLRLPAEKYTADGVAAFKRWLSNRMEERPVQELNTLIVRTQFRQAFANKNYADALKFIDEEIQLLTKQLAFKGNENNVVLQGHVNAAWAAKGVVLIDDNRAAEAITALTKSTAQMRQMLAIDGGNANTQLRIARNLTHLGKALLMQKEAKEATLAFKASVDEYEKLNGKDVPAYVYPQQAEAMWRAMKVYEAERNTIEVRRYATMLINFAKTRPPVFSKKPAEDWLGEAKKIATL
jgi:serine/threonine protein kinase